MVKTSAVPTEQGADSQFRVVGFNPATNSTAAIALNRVKEVLGLALVSDFDASVAAIRAEMDYRLSSLAFGLVPRGSWSPTEAAFPANAEAGDYWLISEDGTLAGETFTTGNWLIAKVDNAPTGVWSGWETTDWVRVWTEHNDGAGSGLDADLLDGKQSSEFVHKDSAEAQRIKGQSAVLVLGDDGTVGEVHLGLGRDQNGGTIPPTSVEISGPSGQEIPQIDIAATLLALANNLRVNGALDVQGNALFAGPVQANGTVNLGSDATVQGTLTANGALRLSGTGNDPNYFVNLFNGAQLP